MGKPRMIILIRHAQSEGNLNRDVHQIIPDHRVKLTAEGRKQAHEAGYRLREMLRPDDTIRIFTSPYRRTRETTEGLVGSLTESTSESGPSPFSRSAIKITEDARIREQDFGNFQPCSAEMDRMWQERADYGSFFYRIERGESAADAYDRCAGFNESLWREFGSDEFPSVCILVTHGLMTRVFLMKWYHWTVEYFEDLRNVNHCEFVVMKRNESDKYSLETKMRTWSELKRRATLTTKDRRQSHSTQQSESASSPSVPRRIWGGCVNGCNHDHSLYPRRTQILNATPNTESPNDPAAKPKSDHNSASYHRSLDPSPSTSAVNLRPAPTPLSRPSKPTNISLPLRPSQHDLIRGRDGGGSLSGLPTPIGELSGDESPADPDLEADAATSSAFSPRTGTRPDPQSALSARSTRSVRIEADQDRAVAGGEKEGRKRRPTRQTTTEDVEGWMRESGMGLGRRAEALGDPEEEDEEDEDEDEGGELGAGESKTEEEERGVRESVY
ncbi:histidine phosphatase superfamily [Elsinoe ampelina]|uniref:Histidine phosphatase superfamily n=1 Tax=Elsinoe ampelina TaxID=302913 RepID=A0A6A6GNS7_9PEZI|nr:histidine phosphatase superfamily [Elsinoe ampelina]